MFVNLNISYPWTLDFQTRHFSSNGRSSESNSQAGHSSSSIGWSKHW